MSVPEAHEFPELEQYLRAVADAIKGHLPEGVGFAFWLFDFGENGRLAYGSNAERADVRKLVAEWLERT